MTDDQRRRIARSLLRPISVTAALIFVTLLLISNAISFELGDRNSCLRQSAPRAALKYEAKYPADAARARDKEAEQWRRVSHDPKVPPSVQLIARKFVRINERARSDFAGDAAGIPPAPALNCSLPFPKTH